MSVDIVLALGEVLFQKNENKIKMNFEVIYTYNAIQNLMIKNFNPSFKCKTLHITTSLAIDWLKTRRALWNDAMATNFLIWRQINSFIHRNKLNKHIWQKNINNHKKQWKISKYLQIQMKDIIKLYQKQVNVTNIQHHLA